MKFRVLKLKIVASGSNGNWVIFYCIFTIIGKKHLVVEWLAWLTGKSGFINSNILETSKDRPNTSSSLKLLEQRVYELVGGPLTPLLSDNLVGRKRLRSGRVKGCYSI